MHYNNAMPMMPWQFVRKVAQQFFDDRCSRTAGALSYATLLALVPLTAITLAVFSRFEIFESWMTMAQEFIYANFIPASGAVVYRYLHQFAANAHRLTGWGLLFLALTSFMVIATIERAFNDIWHVPQARKRLRRYLSYGALLILGPLLLGISLSLVTHLISLPVFAGHAPVTAARAFLLEFMPVAFECLVFLLLYTVVPNHPVRWWQGLIGSLFTTLLFEMTKRAFVFFIAHYSAYQTIYGAVAVLPLFLIWIYLSWTVILLGAVVTATFSGGRRMASATRPRRRR